MLFINRISDTSCLLFSSTAMSDSESQEDELLALASIYDENTFSSSTEKGSPGGQFSAVLELPEPFNVIFMGSGQYAFCFPRAHMPLKTVLYFQMGPKKSTPYVIFHPSPFSSSCQKTTPPPNPLFSLSLVNGSPSRRSVT